MLGVDLGWPTRAFWSPPDAADGASNGDAPAEPPHQLAAAGSREFELTWDGLREINGPLVSLALTPRGFVAPDDPLIAAPTRRMSHSAKVAAAATRRRSREAAAAERRSTAAARQAQALAGSAGPPPPAGDGSGSPLSAAPAVVVAPVVPPPDQFAGLAAAIDATKAKVVCVADEVLAGLVLMIADEARPKLALLYVKRTLLPPLLLRVLVLVLRHQSPAVAAVATATPLLLLLLLL